MVLAGLSLVVCIVAFLKGDERTQDLTWAAFQKAFVPIVVLDFGVNAQGTARAVTSIVRFFVEVLP